MRVLGLIPARGGSKGVPRKNIRLLCGKPLLQYTAEAALTARLLTRIVLSTEDEEIAEVGRNCGLWVPFLRPAELAQDDTPTLPVVQHALQELESAGDRFDAVCLLQPTSPMRSAGQIDGCIDLLERSGVDSVMTVLEVPLEFNPHWVLLKGMDDTLQWSTREMEPIPRRQSLPPAYHREGSVYVSRRDIVMDVGSLYGRRILGYEIEPGTTANIDTTEDWMLVERLMAARVPGSNRA
jgi:CMP-N-acetylneuraminic acid synthetase